tara:strand:- start:846 stop:1664 length:819 start_codon:yes stop_codon:yes gene_type:complete
MIKVAILGSAGRMGRALIRGIAESSSLALSAAIDKPGIKSIGEDSGLASGIEANGILMSDSFFSASEEVDVVIDFTSAQATSENIEACLERKVPVVIGTTGLCSQDEERLERISNIIPIVYSSNYSLGVNATMKLVELATRIFGESVDIEIVESHHNKKIDAPSGTAITIGQRIAKVRKKDLNELTENDRSGSNKPRTPGKIGFHAIRGGDIVGDHKILFIGKEESVEITHKAFSRDNFASGALKAAEWVCNKQKGLFAMDDVLKMTEGAKD